MVQKAWSFKAIESDDLRYFGNNGYEDESAEHYRYDNFVANNKNVKKGDLVIITNRTEVLGVSVIDDITSKDSVKLRNKCVEPGCTAKKISPRKKITPKWRCGNDHKFEEPLIVKVPGQEITANYAKSFVTLKNVKMEDLISNTPRYNVQGSIQEVDLKWAKNLYEFNEKAFIPIEGSEADENYNRSDEDERQLVRRAIKLRRGQKKFREKLLENMSQCAVTGCGLVDILEAAHIDAYRNDAHNNVQNGLILRSDIHTLFDLNLLAINPKTFEVALAEHINDDYYSKIKGNKLNVAHEISIDALNERWEKFITLNKLMKEKNDG
jgi:hypothetical protein